MGNWDDAYHTELPVLLQPPFCRLHMSAHSYWHSRYNKYNAGASEGGLILSYSSVNITKTDFLSVARASLSLLALRMQ